jgi:hypothetical protein
MQNQESQRLNDPDFHHELVKGLGRNSTKITLGIRIDTKMIPSSLFPEESVQHCNYRSISDEPMCSLAMIHGMGESSRKYSRIAHYFASNRMDVHLIDLR